MSAAVATVLSGTVDVFAALLGVGLIAAGLYGLIYGSISMLAAEAYPRAFIFVLGGVAAGALGIFMLGL